jgi:hypothetical protein
MISNACPDSHRKVLADALNKNLAIGVAQPRLIISAEPPPGLTSPPHDERAYGGCRMAAVARVRATASAADS